MKFLLHFITLIDDVAKIGVETLKIEKVPASAPFSKVLPFTS
jgi:hypothetical protein